MFLQACKTAFISFIINSQLMPKRINLQVDRLISRPQKIQKNIPERVPPPKAVTFEELFEMARKTCSHSRSAHEHHQHAFSSAQSSQYQAESLKSSVHTPQNSGRGNRQARRDRCEKLNQSLETKSNSLQRTGAGVRSFSSEKVRPGERWQQQQPEQVIRYFDKSDSNHANAREKKDSSPQKSQQRIFQQEFSNLLCALDHSTHSHLRQTECFLSIEEIFKLMRQLHYLRKIEDEKHLVKIWQELQGDTYGGVPSQNLSQFLSFINHCSTPGNLYPKNSKTEGKKIIINSNLKIVASQESKLDIYESYLALRVNRILYGNGEGDYSCSEKKINKTSNIKIVDDQGEVLDKKKTRRLSFAKKTGSGPGTSSAEVGNRRSVKLKTGLKAKKHEETLCKQKSEETICYSEISQTKQSGKNLTSNQSDYSIQTSQATEEPSLPEEKPILSIDVNLGEGLSEKLLVFEGESAVEVSHRLVDKYNIDEALRLKFENMLSGHIRNLLWRIEEVSEEMISDREE